MDSQVLLKNILFAAVKVCQGLWLEPTQEPISF